MSSIVLDRTGGNWEVKKIFKPSVLRLTQTTTTQSWVELPLPD